ncbi:MAG: prepilin peptidase [Candidatus Roizmanbacteria bacterium]
MDIIAILYIFAFLEGSIIGSFLNVVIDRLPSKESLLGRSHCDVCKRRLGMPELVPIFSYIMQKGVSACCHRKLKIQYPLIEFLTAATFVLIVGLYHSLFGVDRLLNELPVVITLFALAAITIAISIIDFRHHIIPDELQVCLIVAALAHAYLAGHWSTASLMAGLIVSQPLLMIYMLTRGRGMGFGDVKLEVGLGIWLGIIPGLLGVYLGFLIGAIYGLALLIIHRAKRQSHIAFGPSLLIGGWLAYFIGDIVIQFYRGLLGI